MQKTYIHVYVTFLRASFYVIIWFCTVHHIRSNHEYYTHTYIYIHAYKVFQKSQSPLLIPNEYMCSINLRRTSFGGKILCLEALGRAALNFKQKVKGSWTYLWKGHYDKIFDLKIFDLRWLLRKFQDTGSDKWHTLACLFFEYEGYWII